MNEPAWKHDDVFPIIARIIGERYQQQPRYVTAPEITDSLLADPEARSIIEAARNQQAAPQSLEWIASNMVSWFSQQITIGTSRWQSAFERMKIDDRWAYIPRQSHGETN